MSVLMNRRYAWSLPQKALPLLLLVLIATSSKAAEIGFPVGRDATADKPQSKCWFHDGAWWCILFDGEAGSFFYRFVNGSWQKQTFPDALVYPLLRSRADVLSKSDTLVVLAWEAREPRLYKYTYAASLKRYELQNGFPVPIDIPPGHETLVMAQDSTGVLWIAFEREQRVWVFCSDAHDHHVWETEGVEIAQGLKDDDIASIIGFEGQIGVLWSNQKTQSLYFRVHQDGTPKAQWQPTELVAEGGYVADDHINLACSTDGHLYAVTKTSVDDAEQPVNGPTQSQFILNVRNPSREWTMYDIEPVSEDIGLTRPIVVLDEANQEVNVFYKRGDAIAYKRSSMDSIDFSGRAMTALTVQGVSLNNVTSTKQNLSAETGLMILATGNDNRTYHRLFDIR